MSETNWERLDALEEKDIDLSDTSEITPEMLARAIIRHRLKPVPPKAQMTKETASVQVSTVPTGKSSG